MKALICYWGLVRGFKYPQTLESHKKHIWDVLTSQGIEYDVMLHTFNKEFDFQVFNIDKLRYIVIEDDIIITNRLLPRMINIHMPIYFTEEHKRGLFKCWHSQQHLCKQIALVQNEYDIVITLDIAQYFVSSLPRNIKDLDMSKMYLTNFERFNGYNPRFCMSNPTNAMFYLNKLDYVLCDPNNIPDKMVDPEYKEKYIETYMRIYGESRDAVKEVPNLHPEWQLKQYLDVVGKKEVKEIDIRFYRIRQNAHLEGMTAEDVALYNVKVVPEGTKL